MPSIFLSHSSRDHILAQDLVGLLRAGGYPSLFLDFDPDVGIPAGRKWEEELYAALRSCDAVIFLSSNASVASKWCFAELALARSLNRPVIGLVLDPDARHPLVKDTQTIDWWERSVDAQHRLLTGLQRVGLAPHDVFDWNLQRPPYPGLDRFESADAGVFFGRDPEITTLLQSLDTTLLEIRSRLVVVTGPSGSGKSSLVRAGLVPRLLRKPERWALVGPFVPGQHPVGTLAREMARALAVRNSMVADWRRIERRVRKSPDAFVRLAQDILVHSPAQPDSLLVLIDQFEEVVTRSGQSERQGLLDMLRMGLTAPGSPLWVLATVRSEFITPLLSTGALAGLHARTMLVSPPDRVTLSQMIELPAARAGLLLDDGLTQRMVHDAGQGDALPLLAYTLRQLYDKAGRDRRLGLSDYEAIGGVEGALQARANQTMDELTQRYERETVLHALLATVTLSPDHEPMRRRVERSALSDDENRILDVFVGARLYKAGEEAGSPVIEVAHEALIRTWSPLRAAVEEAWEGLRLRADLDQAALEWQREGRHISYLWTGDRLAAAAHHAESETSASPLVRAFVAESTGHDRAMVEHRSEMIANQALREVDDPERAILLALAAVEENAPTVRALLALSTAITQSRLRGRVVDDEVYKVVSSPDGRILLTLRHELYSTDLTATRLESDTELYTFSEPTISDARFSASGEWIATASEEGTATLRNARTGERRFSTDPQPGTWNIAEDGTETVLRWMAATSVALSTDGRLLAVVRESQYLDVWDSVSARRLWSRLPEDQAMSVAFSADDRQVLCGGRSGHLSVYETETGNIVSTSRPHDSLIESIATSAMGVLTTSDDRTARVEYADRRAVRLLGHTEAVTGGVLSSDATRVITYSVDGTARYWNAITGRQILTLRPHPAEVRSVYFAHDQRRAVTLSDGHTSLWDLASFDELDVLLHEDDVTTLAFSPEGSSLVTGTLGGVIRDWDLKAGTVTREFPRFDQNVYGVAFSVDGSRVITSSDTKAVVWSWPSGRRLRTIHGEYGVLSPDGQRVFVASRTRTGVVKDVRSGKTVVRFTDKFLDEDDESEPATGVFSPDGSDIVTASGDRSTAVWSVSDGEFRFLLEYGMTTPAYSPDGACLALAKGSDVHVMWNPPDGETVVLSGHEGPVRHIAFAPDGRLVITSSYDASARLWDPRTGELIRVIRGHEPEFSVNQAAFSPDYTMIATASGDRTVRIWKHQAPGDWLQLAHQRVFRSLTVDERVRYGLS